ncbi:site-specific integrase [Formosa sp. Hel1_31_208]|uniref:site-specific integrase n=1 Tax=Formosa sp. Hel1_31_208 TaxID=1798225 RepID=UPI00155FF8F9|nr:site-specific integrase [Formosa sp. Hel1_31_208]
MANTVLKTKVSVNFVLKEPKAKNETLIVFRVSAGRKIDRRFSTGYKVKPKYWDSTKKKVRNVATVSNSLEINNYLDQLKNEFNKIVADRISKGEMITKDSIKEIYHSISNKEQIKESDETMTFFKYCDVFIEGKIRTLQKDNKRAKSTTVSAYKQAIKHIKEFQKDEGFKVDFDSIDLEFYYSFVEYMQTKEKVDGSFYAINTIGKHIKTLKTILNSATNEGHNSNSKYKLPEFKIVNELTTAVYLDMDELKNMFELDLSKYPEHEKARDIFILGCETGQRISDYNNFSNCQIIKEDDGEYIQVVQKKTRNKVYCFITPVMRKIMNDRYNGNPPKPMIEQYINACIKEVAQMAGINKRVKFERNEGGNQVVKEILKYKLISTHTARRSYSTIKYRAGVNVHDIMPLTGHKSEREFLKYIREDGKDRASRIVQSNAFKDSYLKVV